MGYTKMTGYQCTVTTVSTRPKKQGLRSTARTKAASHQNDRVTLYNIDKAEETCAYVYTCVNSFDHTLVVVERPL